MEVELTTQKIESEIITSYRLFREYYNTSRDLDSIVSLFSPHITNIGTGSDELTPDFESVVQIFRRDLEQCPSELIYKEKTISVQVINPAMGLLIAHYDQEGIINDIPFTHQDLRISILWEKEDEKWLIRHIHLSQSEPTLNKGESFPLAEIEEKNQLLEKIVNKRTRDLCKLNIHLSEANKEINEINQRFETIFEKASDGIIVADWKNHSFFMINQRICEILGYTKKQMQGFWLADLIPQEDLQESFEKMLQESNGDRIIADDIPLICSNNEIKYFDITSQPIKINNKNYLVSLYRDITEHKKTVQLRQQAEVARKASEAKNLFLANMSHEIRTPVTGIMGMSEILAKTELTDQQAEYLHIINESSRILLTLINDMLDISKIEAGKLVLREERFKLSDLINNIKVLTHSGLISRKNKLEIIMADNIPIYLFTDKMRLEQIIMNLINNAMKFTENGIISLHIDKATGNKRELLKISVTDTGPGISNEDQSKLFQKFQQIDTSLSRPADGSGLGLFICRQLVTLLDGHIGVNSKPGEGSTFWFTFKSQALFNEEDSEKDIEISSDIPLNLNVLLVDDKKVNLQVISIMLQTAKCKIETAVNGLEALEKFDPQKHDVVFMDIMMPIMDGITAMKELRKKYKENMRPIIAITANAMAGDKEKYLAEGFDAYITKPLTMQKLTSELLQLGILAEKKEKENW
jgi:PAS domain S-box-containing protein